MQHSEEKQPGNVDNLPKWRLDHVTSRMEDKAIFNLPVLRSSFTLYRPNETTVKILVTNMGIEEDSSKMES